MKKRFLAIPAVIMLAALGMALTVRGQTDGFIIEGADETSVLDLAPSSTLNDLIKNIAPRFIMEAADNNREYSFTPAPAELLTLLSQAADRMIMEAADANRHYTFTPAPAALLELLGQAADRFVMEAADGNRFYQLAYPAELINDSTAPLLSNIAVEAAGPDSVTVSWSTNEFADSEVRFGVESGVYDKTVADPLYVKSHQVILDGLSEDVTYYFIIRSRDQSGNMRQSAERTFELTETRYVYLPAVLRK